MKPIYAITVVLFVFIFGFGQAQQDARQKPQITVTKTIGSITIDGVLDEEGWSAAETSSPFLNKWPQDSGFAAAKTEVKMLFDDTNLYIAAVNFGRSDDFDHTDVETGSG